MTGAEFVDSIVKYLTAFKENMDFPIDDREVWMISCDVLNSYAKQGLFENMKLDDPTVPNQYVTTFTDIKIFYDKKRALCYINLPATPINLPHRKGYRMIAPIRNMEARFWIVDANEAQSAMSIMGNGTGRVLAWPEGKKLYLSKRFDDTDAHEVMAMLVISGASSISMDAEMPIDPSLIQQIRADVISYFSPKVDPQLDTTRDGK